MLSCSIKPMKLPYPFFAILEPIMCDFPSEESPNGRLGSAMYTNWNNVVLLLKTNIQTLLFGNQLQKDWESECIWNKSKRTHTQKAAVLQTATK